MSKRVPNQATKSTVDPMLERVLIGFARELNEAVRLARRLEAEAGSPGILGGLSRLVVKASSQGARGGNSEINQLSMLLRQFHARLGPRRQAQLRRELGNATAEMAAVRVDVEQQLVDDDRLRAPWLAVNLAQALRDRVKDALNAIFPPEAAPADEPAADSILPPAARAFATGRANYQAVAAHLDERWEYWWGRTLRRQGIGRAQPLRRELGNDPLRAVTAVPRLLGGIPIGTTVDPQAREPRGTAVVDPAHSVLALGASGVGKTTGVVAPYALWQTGAGANVVVVTPQVGTLKLILPAAQALTGQSSVPIIDFGGEIVSPNSKKFRPWDVTRQALTGEGARNFAEVFAGPNVPARQQLSSSEYWGGIVASLYAAAAHITANMREVYGLDPNGLNGMARVYDFLRLPGDNPFPTELPAEVRAALQHSPEELRRQGALLRMAAEYAKRFHPRLQKLAFQEALLRAQEVALSDDIVGPKLQALNVSLREISRSKSGDPMETLLQSFQQAVPPHEVLVMSPRPGQDEVDPAELVKPGAGISFVTYAHVGSTGAAPGAFTTALIDAAIKQNKRSLMLTEMGGKGDGARLSLVVDEGNAGRYITQLPQVVTDTRQLQISALLSMTSLPHLEEVFGEENAGKFEQAPCVIDLSPDPDRADKLAGLFGKRDVVRISNTTGANGDSTTTSSEREPVLSASDLMNVPRGQAVMTYASDPEANRVRLVQLSQVADPQTLLGEAVAYVNENPNKFPPVAELLAELQPELAQVVRIQRRPASALSTGGPEALAEVLADLQRSLQEDPARHGQAGSEPARTAGEPASGRTRKPSPRPVADGMTAGRAAPAKEEVAPAKGEPGSSQGEAATAGAEPTSREPAQPQAEQAATVSEAELLQDGTPYGASVSTAGVAEFRAPSPWDPSRVTRPVKDEPAEVSQPTAAQAPAERPVRPEREEDLTAPGTPWGTPPSRRADEAAESTEHEDPFGRGRR